MNEQERRKALVEAARHWSGRFEWGAVVTLVESWLADERRRTTEEIADDLGELATERLKERGPHDPRAAALWDAHIYIREQMFPRDGGVTQ